MINAQEARNITTKNKGKSYYDDILDFLDKKIRIAAKNGYVSLSFQAPSTTPKEILEEVRKTLIRFGYGVEVWEEQKQIRISW